MKWWKTIAMAVGSAALQLALPRLMGDKSSPALNTGNLAKAAASAAIVATAHVMTSPADEAKSLPNQ